ncbi:MAG TPA: chromosomal replication initiator protein DnaA [Phycisphaerales bacterium]|nr:chromosomal replication initiator protein DnaA [Phycisphaerales bacterium]
MDPDRQIWDAMLAHLRANYPTLCRQWFEELEPVGIGGGSFQLRARSALHRDYLKKQCAEPFNDAARSATGRLLAIRFLGPDDEIVRPPAPPKKAEPARPAPPHVNGTSSNGTHAAPPPGAHTPAPLPEIKTPPPVESPRDSHRYESLVVNPDCSFENFVVGPANRLAHAAAMAVAANPGRTYNPFFVHGGVGLGKTHLLQAVCLKIAESNPRAVLYYTSCEGFVTQFFDCVQNGDMNAFRHRFRDVDVLVIDDIHFLTKRDRSQEEFFHTFNALYQANKQIILSSDAPPEEIPDLEERLVSRFKWGLVTKIDQPCYETRMAILKTKAKLRGLFMPDEVAQYLAQRIETNVRELEGAVVKLQILSATHGRPIDLEMAHEAVGDQAPAIVGEPTIQNIISAVTEFYSIRLADLQGKHRQRSIALPRQVCMYLSRRCTRHSLEEIGGFFGGRDHTTVMHAIRTVDTKRGGDADFDLVVRSLEEKVRNPRGAQAG